MIDLSSHIEFLLLRHDCVVVPGLGAFLVHEESARYDADSGLFLPPRRSLGFNPVVTHNDGLLAESVARREGLSIESATQNVHTEVSAFRHQLSMSGELPVGSLGVMSVGSEPDALLFEPNEDSSVSMSYSGLLPVPVSPIVEEEAETIATPVAEAGRHVVFPLPLKIAASFIFLLVACGLLYSTTNLVDNGSQTYASLDSGLSERVEAAGMVPGGVADNLSRDIILNIAKPAEPSDEPVSKSSVDGDAVGRYLLVVASLPSRNAAERHIGHIGTDGLSIIEMDGKFRVFVSSCRTSGEAYAAAESLRDHYPNVWVCKR